MEEKTGHFEQGAWVTGETATEAITAPEPTKSLQQPPIDQRISDISGRMSRDIIDLFHLTHDLLTTEAGHKHIGQLMARAGEELEKTINDLVEEAKTNGKEQSTDSEGRPGSAGKH